MRAADAARKQVAKVADDYATSLEFLFEQVQEMVEKPDESAGLFFKGLALLKLSYQLLNELCALLATDLRLRRRRQLAR